MDKLIYTAMTGAKAESRNAELEAACLSIAEDDEAGQRWCAKHGYPGYTSYASLNDLPWRVPVFGDLLKELDKHVTAFAKELEFDLQGRKLVLDSLWINILPPGGIHTSAEKPLSSNRSYVVCGKPCTTTRPPGPRVTR